MRLRRRHSANPGSAREPPRRRSTTRCEGGGPRGNHGFTRVGRLLVWACLAALVLAAPAAGDDIVGKKRAVDARIASLHASIAQTRAREDALKGEIAQVTGRIRVLQDKVGDVSQQLQTLEADLALHRERLAKLAELFQLQTTRLVFLREQHRVAVERRDLRLIAIYEAEDPSTLAVALSARSFEDLLDKLEYVRRISALDKRIALAVGRAKRDMIAARGRTARTKKGVASETRVIAARTAQQRSVRDRLVASRDDLSDARRHKLVSLSQLSEEERAEASEIDALQAQSASLAARIRAAQSQGSTPPQTGTGQLSWPVSGPVTSPFGWRWGRMHEGIDIAAPSGTSVHAAGTGTVIYAAWMEGYGNLVVIDHGGGLATAYAHLSAYATSSGQLVTVGQTIGYVGCTGHCFGPHLHFEVRVNGAAVDPLGYL
jgi:murein DD-endopeptidase MepM/ murein hydrolase activator NlpD